MTEKNVKLSVCYNHGLGFLNIITFATNVVREAVVTIK